MTRTTREQAAAIARAEWVAAAACRNKPDFCTDPHDRIAATCSDCPAISDCARLGAAELLASLASSDMGEGRVYAGHQLSELVSIGRTSKAQALTLLDIAGGLTKHREDIA